MRITCAVRPAPQAFMVNPMFEFLIGILTHTPVWVWVLFIFLISRGLNARKPATVTLERLAIIPAIFLIWDIYDLVVYRDLTLATVALWVAGIVAGAALPFMMLAFGVKYVLGVMNALSPQTLQQPAMSALAIVSGGVFAGVFIGKFTRYVSVYLSGAPQPAE